LDCGNPALAVRGIGSTSYPPAFAVLSNPVEQGALKADVVTKALGFEPFMTKNLFSLC
jgi:hypothetical protein